MTIEQLVPAIVKALRRLPEPPWHVSGDNAADTEHRESGLALVDTGRTEDWPIARLCEWFTADFIASSPRWLAQMVVGIVEEREDRYMHTGDWRQDMSLDAAQYQALRDFSLTESDWIWLKEKVRE